MKAVLLLVNHAEPHHAVHSKMVQHLYNAPPRDLGYPEVDA